MISEEIRDFVRAVIYDGRYLDIFTNKPEKISHELGIELNEDSLTMLKKEKQTEILSKVIASMNEAYANTKISKVLGQYSK